MNYTENYQLNQWDAGDRVLREDFNSDNEKIDAAMAAIAAAAGNCRVKSGTYVGTGTYNNSSTNVKLNLGVQPVLLLLTGNGHAAIIVGGGNGLAFDSSTTTRGLSVTWGDNGVVSWISTGNTALQLNYQMTYTYYAFYL